MTPGSRDRVSARGISWALASALVGASSGVVRAEPPAADLLDCTTLPKNADEATLARRFGRAALTTVDLVGAEGQTDRGTAVNAGDPARRLNVFWSDPTHRRGPATVVIRDHSRWRVRLPGGATLGLGAGLHEVELANGRPFAVSGFYWDYGGYATDWKGGDLSALPGGCTLSVRFDPDPKVSGPTADRASGEKTFSSTSPVLKAVVPRVSVLSLDWPD